MRERMQERTEFLNRLVDEHYERLERFLISKIFHSPGCRDIVDETLQETYLAAAKAYGTLRVHPNVAGWLTKVAQHVLYRKMKKKVRHDSRTVSLTDESIYAAVDNVDSWLNMTQNNDAIRQIRSVLTEKENAVLDCFCQDRLTIRETAMKTGYTESAVKSTLHRIRKKAGSKHDDYPLILLLLLSATFQVVMGYIK